MKEAANIVRETQKKSSFGSVATFLEKWNGSDDGFVRIIQRKFA